MDQLIGYLNEYGAMAFIYVRCNCIAVIKNSTFYTLRNEIIFCLTGIHTSRTYSFFFPSLSFILLQLVFCSVPVLFVLFRFLSSTPVALVYSPT